MRPADGRGRRLAQAEVTHLPLPDQLRHGADGLFDGDVWIDAVLVVEVDGIDAQPPERAFAGLAHVFRAAVYASPPYRLCRRRSRTSWPPSPGRAGRGSPCRSAVRW